MSWFIRNPSLSTAILIAIQPHKALSIWLQAESTIGGAEAPEPAIVCRPKSDGNIIYVTNDCPYVDSIQRWEYGAIADTVDEEVAGIRSGVYLFGDWETAAEVSSMYEMADDPWAPLKYLSSSGGGYDEKTVWEHWNRRGTRPLRASDDTEIYPDQILRLAQVPRNPRFLEGDMPVYPSLQACPVKDPKRGGTRTDIRVLRRQFPSPELTFPMPIAYDEEEEDLAPPLTAEEEKEEDARESAYLAPYEAAGCTPVQLRVIRPTIPNREPAAAEANQQEPAIEGDQDSEPAWSSDGTEYWRADDTSEDSEDLTWENILSDMTDPPGNDVDGGLEPGTAEIPEMKYLVGNQEQADEAGWEWDENQRIGLPKARTFERLPAVNEVEYLNYLIRENGV